MQLLANQLEPLTEQQLMGIYNLQQSSQQAEDALSQGMEALQQSLAETLANGNPGSSGSSANVANYMGQMAMAMGKLGTLEGFLRQVIKKNLSYNPCHFYSCNVAHDLPRLLHTLYSNHHCCRLIHTHFEYNYLIGISLLILIFCFGYSQADNLRQQTLEQMHRILTTRQSARALLAIHDYFSRLRALSSLWLARPQE